MKTNPCHNRPAFKPSMWVQDGWTHSAAATSRLPRMVVVPFRMAADCQYAKDDRYADPGCVGCVWKSQSGARAPL